MPDAITIIFELIILVFSVIIHEVSHGLAANAMGDPTAKYAGRLTLNPLVHLDLFGSILLPAILVLSGAHFLFGWAKPVPYNPNNLSDKKWGTIWVSAAGILANIFIAVIFGLLVRFSAPYNFPVKFYNIASSIVVINLALALFNLVPIPPLDGSKILFSLLPRSFSSIMYFMERYSFIFVIIFVFYFSGLLAPVLKFSFHLLTGLAF